MSLQPKLDQVKERVRISPSADVTSGDQSIVGKTTRMPHVSKRHFAGIEKGPPRTPRPLPRCTRTAPATTANLVSTGGGPLPPPPSLPPPPPGGPPRPPPPPGCLAKGVYGGDKVHRAPSWLNFTKV